MVFGHQKTHREVRSKTTGIWRISHHLEASDLSDVSSFDPLKITWNQMKSHEKSTFLHRWSTLNGSLHSDLFNAVPNFSAVVHLREAFGFGATRADWIFHAVIPSYVMLGPQKKLAIYSWSQMCGKRQEAALSRNGVYLTVLTMGKRCVWLVTSHFLPMKATFFPVKPQCFLSRSIFSWFRMPSGNE